MSLERYQLRVLSTNVALAVGVLSAVLVWVMGSNLGFVGIPIAALLGWCLAPNLQPPKPSNVRAAVTMAVGCTLFGAYGVAVMWTGDPLASVAFGIIGVLVYGIPAFLVLNIPAFAWALTTSWLAGRAVGIGDPSPTARKPSAASAAEGIG